MAIAHGLTFWYSFARTTEVIMLKWMVAGTLLFSVACSETTPSQVAKTPANPDAEFVGDKADALSNRWTTIVGTLDLNGTTTAEIDYPDWYHGYTFSVEAGTTVDLDVTSSEDSLVRVYGPSYRTAWDGRPLFRSAIKRDSLPATGIADLKFTAEETGTYMVLVGPEYVWNAQYSITASTERRCTDDADCGVGESCEHNGVFCITTPCDVSYNICKPVEGCTSDADCQDGWCAPTEDGGQACKSYVAEGERCGGFRPAHLNEACTPDMICSAPYDVIADIPGSCSLAEVTVAELKANPAAYDGHHVVVRTGSVIASPAYCTKMACPIDDPCCNRCGAQLMLADARDAVAFDAIDLTENGNTLSCSGDSCDMYASCDVEIGNYWIAGWFKYDPTFQTASLDITRRYARP